MRDDWSRVWAELAEWQEAARDVDISPCARAT
ncbi:Uncharacterised protein [Bordetella pertussis]|nr:Uncharacterised protein [Bordetella pertussis]